MTLYRLADRLKKTLGEILDMPLDEYVGWLAFFSIEAKDK